MAITSRRAVVSTHSKAPNITIENTDSHLDQGLGSDNNEDVAPDSEDNDSLVDEDARDEDHDDVENQNDIYGQDPRGQQRSDYNDLGTLLRRCGIQHADRRRIKRFWPTQLLNLILTQDRIIEELQAYRTKDPTLFAGKALDALSNNILLYHLRIFAILTLIGQGPCIENVMEEGLQDRHLPLVVREASCQLYRVNRNPPRKHLVKCFSGLGWQPFQRDGFSDLQYAIKPHKLDLEKDGRTPRHRDFHLKVVLPFMHEEDRQQGGYGSVTEVKIHPDCHGFHGILQSIKTNNSFALKLLLKQDREEFQREADALKRFNGFGNDHMVTLLMTWTLDGRYYLLFPLAKCDLDEYWIEHPRPVLDRNTVRWTSKQIVGIASALESIHDPPSNSLQVREDHKYGRHGDLKPENILLYDSPTDDNGILVVADLGLSTLNSILSRSIQSNKRMHFTPRYKPPECDIEGAKVTRSYDVWTFGCLLLEWVCWLFQGQPARAQFLDDLHSAYPSGSSADMFFDMEPKIDGEHQVIIKPQVLERMKELHADGQCTQYFHDLLYLIEEEMMVIRAADRIGSRNLRQRLEGMDERVQGNEDYYRTPRTMPRPAKSQDPLDATFKKLSPKKVQIR